MKYERIPGDNQTMKTDTIFAFQKFY